MNITFLQASVPQFTPIIRKEVPRLKESYPTAQWERYEEEYITSSKDYWILTVPWMCRFRTDKKEETFTIMVEPGWITDFGSVPTIARSFVNHTDTTMIHAFLIHDVLYAIKDYSKVFSDDILYAVMKWSNASKIRSALAYYAVYAFGDTAWYGGCKWIDYEKQWANINTDYIPHKR